MKSRVLQLVPVLLVISFAPTLCRAQAEINPDHFDSLTNVSTVENEAMSNRNPSQAYGSFFLPYDVRCASTTLTAGYYSLSVRQSGKRNVIKLTPIVNGVRAQAVEVIATPRLSPQAPSGLVVDRNNQQRILTAISLREPGVTLFLQTVKNPVVSMDAELIPLSSPASTGLPSMGN